MALIHDILHLASSEINSAVERSEVIPLGAAESFVMAVALQPGSLTADLYGTLQLAVHTIATEVSMQTQLLVESGQPIIALNPTIPQAVVELAQQIQIPFGHTEAGSGMNRPIIDTINPQNPAGYSLT